MLFYRLTVVWQVSLATIIGAVVRDQFAELLSTIAICALIVEEEMSPT